MESIQAHSPSTTGPTGAGSHSQPGSEPSRGPLLAVARELYARLSAGDDRLGYSVGPGCVWTWQRACVEGCGGGANCTHDRPRRPVDGAIVPPREWRPAVEVVRGLQEAPRVLTPWTVAHHLEGRTTIAAASSSWTSWVALDIDAHAPAGDAAAKAAAIARRDRMLAVVWRACGWSSTVQPIVLLSPGQGFHLWLPITRDGKADGGPVEDHRWPSGWARSWMVHHLADAGIAVRGGAVEVFPSGNRLRAPCGRGSLLLAPTNPDDPDRLELAPVAGTYRDRAGGERVRQVAAMAAAFVACWDAQRRPLAAWLGDRPGARWDPRWGFLAHRVSTATAAPDLKSSGGLDGRMTGRSHERDAVLGPPSGEVSGSALDEGRVAGSGAVGPVRGGGGKRGVRGSRSRVSETDVVKLNPSPVRADTQTMEDGGPLVRGATYHAKVARLLAEGITTEGTRHDAVLILTFHFACSGMSDPEVLEEIRTWCRAHAHAGSEATVRGAFERECVGCAARYLRSHGHGWRRGGAGGRRRVVPRALADADQAVIGAVDPAVVDEVRALLGFLAGLPRTASGRPGEAVELAGGLLYALAPERRVVVEGARRRRAWSVAVEELVRIGVLSLHTGASPGAHGRVFCCWYRFGSGELPTPATVPAAAWADAAPPAAPAPTLAEAAPAPPPCAGGEAVAVRELAARGVPEGRLRVLAAEGERFPRVLLEPAAAAPEVYTPARGAWWARMYRARRFTPAELESATPGRVVPFPGVRPPWARAPGAPLVGPADGAVVPLRAAPGGSYDPPIEVAPTAPAAVDPRAALGARLGAAMDGIDRDLAAVALRALARWRPRD